MDWGAILQVALTATLGVGGTLGAVVLRQVAKSISAKRRANEAREERARSQSVKTLVLDLAGVFVEEQMQTFVRKVKKDEPMENGRHLAEKDGQSAFDLVKGRIIATLEDDGVEMIRDLGHSFVNAAIEGAVSAVKARQKNEAVMLAARGSSRRKKSEED